MFDNTSFDKKSWIEIFEVNSMVESVTVYIYINGNIRNPALPVMPRHYQQNDEISFLKVLLG